MKTKKTVNGATHTAEYSYTGLTEEVKKTYNKLYAEAIKKEGKK